MVLAALAVPASATASGRLLVPGPLGTVDTVAGPKFCSSGGASRDPASLSVGALAAHASDVEAVWYESGAPDKGRIIQAVTGRGGRIVFDTGLRLEGQDGGAAAGRRAITAASRLASDPGGGAIIGAERGVHHLKDGPTTLAGIPLSQSEKGEDPGAAGDGGPYWEARFRRVAALATDERGIYVADEVDSTTSTIVIRFLNRSDGPVVFYPGTEMEIAVAPRTIETIAGTSPETEERLRGRPELVAAAPVLAVSGDRLYIAAAPAGPSPRATVRVLNLGGSRMSAHGKTVDAGAMAPVAAVDGNHIPAGSTRASPLPGIAVDPEGNLFLAERTTHRVRRLSPTGQMTTFAGTGAAGFNGNDRPALEARLNLPYDVEVGGGRVYISDAGNNQVRYVDRAGNIHAAPGAGAGTEWLCQGPQGTGPGDEAYLGSPTGLAIDVAGNAYLAAIPHRQVFRVAPSGSVSAVGGTPRPCGAGSPAACGVLEDGPSHQAFLTPHDLASGPGGGLYLLEPTRVRLLNTSRRALTVHGVAVGPRAIRTVAGVAPSPSAAGLAPAPAPTAPVPGATPPTAPQAPVPDAVVGSRALGVGPVTGSFTAAVADARGHLFIAEVHGGPSHKPLGKGRILEVDRRGIVVATLNESPLDPSRCCSFPTTLALDHRGNLYIGQLTLGSPEGRGEVDALVHGQVWYLNRSKTTVEVHGVAVPPGSTQRVAGTPTFRVFEEGDPALKASINPQDLAVDRSGNLYVASGLDGHSVYRVDERGAMTTVVGTGQPGFNGDGLKGRLTALSQPEELVLDPCGNLLIGDFGNHRVRRLNLVAACRVGPGTSGATSREASSLALVAIVLLSAVCAGAAAHRRRRRPRSGRSTPSPVN